MFLFFSCFFLEVVMFDVAIVVDDGARCKSAVLEIIAAILE